MKKIFQFSLIGLAIAAVLFGKENFKKLNLSQAESSIIILFSGLVMVIWGAHGIIKRKTIRNHSNLVFSVGQLVSGFIALTAFTMIYFGYGS